MPIGFVGMAPERFQLSAARKRRTENRTAGRVFTGSSSTLAALTSPIELTQITLAS
jgi:hypothetical protein